LKVLNSEELLGILKTLKGKISYSSISYKTWKTVWLVSIARYSTRPKDTFVTNQLETAEAEFPIETCPPCWWGRQVVKTELLLKSQCILLSE